MIIGKFHNFPNYDELVAVLERHYDDVQSGYQSDYWVWINKDNDRFQIDNFTSVDMEMKSKNPDYPLAEELIAFLAERYALDIFDEPELEAHEG